MKAALAIAGLLLWLAFSFRAGMLIGAAMRRLNGEEENDEAGPY